MSDPSRSSPQCASRELLDFEHALLISVVFTINEIAKIGKMTNDEALAITNKALARIDERRATPPQGSPSPEREALRNVLDRLWNRAKRKGSWPNIEAWVEECLRCAPMDSDEYIDAAVTRDALAALTPRAVEKAGEPLSRNELHAIAHARYQVEQASPEKPECCFDYDLVKDLLRVIDRTTPSGADVREAVIEECAKLADWAVEAAKRSYGVAESVGAHMAARAIRALLADTRPVRSMGSDE